MSSQMPTSTGISRTGSKNKKLFSILLLFIVTAVLIAAGLIYYRSSYQATDVCRAKVVARYNEILSLDSAEHKKQLGNLVNNTIKKQGRYRSEPTCVYIEARLHIAEEDADSLRESIDRLEAFEKAKKEVDPDVLGYQKASDLKVYLKIFEHNESLKGKIDGAG